MLKGVESIKSQKRQLGLKLTIPTLLVVGGWINWKCNQLSPRLVVGGWMDWKYNQLGRSKKPYFDPQQPYPTPSNPVHVHVHVVGGWIDWKYNQLSRMLVAGLIGTITNSAQG